MLHQHALESIFGCLSFDELRFAVLVSSRWQAAVGSMRGIANGRNLEREEEVDAALPSRLARHISSIGCVDENFTASQREPMFAVALSRVQVEQIAARMPFLQQLHFNPLATSDWLGPLRLPSMLHTLSLHFDVDHSAAASQNPLICAVAASLPLLEVLSLGFEESVPTHVTFAPLQALLALKALHLDTPEEYAQLTSTQVAELRAVTQLEDLGCPFDTKTLLQLLQPPSNSQLQWTDMPLCSCITDAVAALLPSLSNLQTLLFNDSFCHVSSLDFLAQLPALTALEFSPSERNGRMEALLLSLAVSLPRVTSLQLFSSFDTPQLTALLARFPQLRQLRLHVMYRFDALTFLEPVRSTLRSMSLHRCQHPQFQPEALLFLRSFSLTHLALSHCFDRPLDAVYRWALTPPSAMLTTLEQFDYTPPDPEA